MSPKTILDGLLSKLGIQSTQIDKDGASINSRIDGLLVKETELTEANILLENAMREMEPLKKV